MKKRKALSTSGVVTDMLLASSGTGIERITSHFNQIVKKKEYLWTGTLM